MEHAAGGVEFRAENGHVRWEGRMWGPMMDMGGWRWTKAVPTFPLIFEPAEKRRTSSSEEGGRETQVRVEVRYC